MKKLMALLTVLSLSLLLLAGCSQAGEGSANDDTEQKIETVDRVEARDAVDGQEDSTAATADDNAAANDQNDTDSTTNTPKSYIGAEKAKEIALAKAGFTAAQVRFTEVELEMDDGVELYQIEFIHGTKEYDFDIHAYNGTILEYDVDYVND